MSELSWSAEYPELPDLSTHAHICQIRNTEYVKVNCDSLGKNYCVFISTTGI